MGREGNCCWQVQGEIGTILGKTLGESDRLETNIRKYYCIQPF